jgi:putative colanic acid biosynthesis UDP-glucose lipid carrier transferase
MRPQLTPREGDAGEAAGMFAHGFPSGFLATLCVTYAFLLAVAGLLLWPAAESNGWSRAAWSRDLSVLAVLLLLMDRAAHGLLRRFGLLGRTRKRVRLWAGFEEVSLGLLVALGVVLAGLPLEILGLAGPLPIDIYATWALLALASLAGVRLLSLGLHHFLIRNGFLYSRVLIVGRADLTRLTVRVLRRERPSAIVAGFVEVESSPDLEGAAVAHWTNVAERAIDAACVLRCDEIVFADGAAGEVLAGQMQGTMAAAAPGLTFLDLASKARLVAGGSSRESFRLVRLSRPALDPRQRLAKAILDRLLALLLIVALAPLFAAIAVAVKTTSSGSLLFVQPRYGMNRRILKIYKFRTLHWDRCDRPDAKMVVPVKPGDPRVTALGRFLRRTSLDELPQLFNVLYGQMSLVGPRPHAVPHDELFATHLERYWARYRVKPGITGWAQVNGLRGEVRHLAEMHDRLVHDRHYIENCSIWFDIRILVKTMICLFSPGKAY